MKQLIFEADVECPSCKGTGIYKGMAERGDAGVICYECEGTGKNHIKHKYYKFEQRNIRTDIKRVYKTAGGYVITDKDIFGDSNICFQKSGVGYKEWLTGAEPLPIKELHCPVMHFGQGTGIGEWFKNHGSIKSENPECEINFNECKKYHKDECWKFYEDNIDMFKSLK